MSASSSDKGGKLSHFDSKGNVRMVDIGGKAEIHRTATAEGIIQMKPETLQLVKTDKAAKGDVLGIARTAAIMAAKRTSELIPLCHALSLTHISVDFSICDASASITCRTYVETIGQTGVEMEALTAVQIALLTIYDMLKATDKTMSFNNVRLVQKTGGQSGNWKEGN